MNANVSMPDDTKLLCKCQHICACSAIVVVVVTTVTLVTLVVNVLSLYVYVRSKELRKRHINNFMISLTLSNLTRCLVVSAPGMVFAWMGR